ncbi:MAG: SAM-dependent chlorinase/fluorinase, partial [Nitrospirota bacterium]
MPSAISVVTLLTDFGERDYFVASMKGVILNINPQARIVDLSHQVGPQQVDEAAYLLKSSYRYFPDGSVHVAVVDPGVGSARRPLLVTTSRYFFVAPDNGLLSYIYQEEAGVEVRQIENKQYRLDSEGTTFDGRDLFAPAAAWLTRGQPPGSYG